MKAFPLLWTLLLLLPVVHPCQGAVVCSEEATNTTSCHIEGEEEAGDCCETENTHHSEDSGGHGDCADDCLGYCCATVVTPKVPAPTLAIYFSLPIRGTHEPALRFYDVTHLIWQPPKRR